MVAVKEAMKFAYTAEGVSAYSEVNGMYTSPVQHSSARSKSILKRAQAYLTRHSSPIQLGVVPATSGAAQHVIVEL